MTLKRHVFALGFVLAAGDVHSSFLEFDILKHVDSNTRYVNFEGNTVTMGSVGYDERSPFERAQVMYPQLISHLRKTEDAPEQQITATTLKYCGYGAVQGDFLWEVSGVLEAERCVLSAKTQLTLCAPSMKLQGVFLTAQEGKVVLRAPEGCGGRVRSLTFVRAPGVRPFDVYAVGEVSFRDSYIHNLTVMGACEIEVDFK